MSQIVGSSIDGQFTNILINNKNLGINPNGMYTQNNGEPYVFLKDFSFINGTTDGSIGSTMVNYKKDQVVYPFPSSPNVRMIPNPAFTKAINEGVLVPQKTAQQQALMQEMSQMSYSGLTDKVFGKQGG